MGLTPKQLRKMAEEEREASRLALVRAELYDRTADELERLPSTRVGGSVVSMTPDQATSRPADILKSVSATRRQGGEGGGLVKAANAAGYSLRRLALELGVSPALTGHYNTGRNPIPRHRAEAIEKLIGYAATLANYPGGIVG